MIIREAAVAGTFYEADPLRLQHHVETLLAEPPPAATTPPVALIVPHAGLIYSGATAARAYACLRGVAQSIRRVLMLGPAHRVYVDGMAIPGARRFRTPLGEIELDHAALARIAALPGVVESDAAHRDEHCLEVQLPFLQTVIGDFELIPVVVGGASAAQVAAVIDTLAGDADTLVVISSDLSHFLDYDSARATDSDTVQRILHKETTLRGEQACGARAINGLMASTLGRDAEIELLQLCNSGDTAGSRNRVVGYAAFILR
ncbi:MAG: AmmeMemoRadiSam system protein B [Gammaproteobacteria bacterium]|nr:AmmeMemoRadiSam system protein B [Gammaproteobacteria bacterium]